LSTYFKTREGDPGCQLLTEEEIAADVIKDSVMEQESGNELQETAIEKELLSPQEIALMQ
jgi:hypothetical protein